MSTREKPRAKKWVDFPLVNDDLALLWMVNMGCIDMNTWYSRTDKPERPDFVLFDLDPAADAGFAETVQVALLVKQALDALGLVSFPKTSGADGMHVLVPIERRHTYEDTRRFAEIIAGALARTNRGLVTTEWTKARRRGVLIDANRNRRGKDDRVGVQRAAEGGCAGLDAAALGRGERQAEPGGLIRWTSCSTASSGSAISTRAC